MSTNSIKTDTSIIVLNSLHTNLFSTSIRIIKTCFKITKHSSISRIRLNPFNLLSRTKLSKLFNLFLSRIILIFNCERNNLSVNTFTFYSSNTIWHSVTKYSCVLFISISLSIKRNSSKSTISNFKLPSIRKNTHLIINIIKKILLEIIIKFLTNITCKVICKFLTKTHNNIYKLRTLSRNKFSSNCYTKCSSVLKMSSKSLITTTTRIHLKNSFSNSLRSRLNTSIFSIFRDTWINSLKHINSTYSKYRITTLIRLFLSYLQISISLIKSSINI